MLTGLRVATLLGITLFTGCAATTAPPPAVFLDPPRAEPILLAGTILLDDETAGRWGWSGAWLFPVGDPTAFGAGDGDGSPGYRVNRGLLRKPRHDGADLSNRRGGGTVRAAANGLVVQVAPSGGGYGAHVVIAHRMPGGQIAYSVYGHLRPNAFQVARGEAVAAGQPLGRVGKTGRASNHHLHFEVRLAADPTVQWQLAEATDPIAFVTDRLPWPPADSSWAAPYLTWAKFAALQPVGTAPDAPMTRADWWRLLARAARPGPDRLPADPDSLCVTLVRAGVLPEGTRGDAGAALPWGEAVRDLDRLSALGLRVPVCPVDPDDHERALANRPAWSPAHLPGGTPTLADALLALADVSLRQTRAGR